MAHLYRHLPPLQPDLVHTYLNNNHNNLTVLKFHNNNNNNNLMALNFNNNNHHRMGPRLQHNNHTVPSKCNNHTTVLPIYNAPKQPQTQHHIVQPLLLVRPLILPLNTAPSLQLLTPRCPSNLVDIHRSNNSRRSLLNKTIPNPIPHNNLSNKPVAL